MKRILFIILALSIVSPAFAESGKVPRFTNHDLKQYGSSRQPEKKVEQDSGEKDADKENPVKEGSENTDAAAKGDDGPVLKRCEVPYKPKEGDAPRIIIDVKFNGQAAAPMLLDTGSPGMVLSYELADRLRLFEVRDGNLLTSASGIGGTIPAIFTIVDRVEVGEVHDEFVPTKITYLSSDEYEGLIGMDFMANYSLEIDTKKHILVFHGRPITPDMPAGHDEDWWRVNFKHFAAMRAGWRRYHKYLKKEERYLRLPKGLIELSARQSRVAESLFSKLNGYAVDHYVPMEWREY